MSGIINMDDSWLTLVIYHLCKGEKSNEITKSLRQYACQRREHVAEVIKRFRNSKGAIWVCRMIHRIVFLLTLEFHATLNVILQFLSQVLLIFNRY